MTSKCLCAFTRMLRESVWLARHQEGNSARMRNPPGSTLSWLFAVLVSFVASTGGVGFVGIGAVRVLAQAPTTTNATAPTTSTIAVAPAVRFGTVYGTAAGKRDGALRLPSRPSRSPLYGNVLHYTSAYGDRADYEQQYRSSFEAAYNSAYETALEAHQQPPAPTPTPARTNVPN